jgi:uncharacterized membrane protein YebE (DUF533 family)
MWRAVVAMVHADGVVTPHELSFINDHIREIGLTSEQMEMVATDLQVPQDVRAMFARITDKQDKKEFFALARALSWCDGDFAKQEEQILKCLERKKLDDENWSLMENSRDLIDEVELCDNQWRFKTLRSKNLFGFLGKKQNA